jgi:uncharacterized membrane protein (DUF2068 family)
MSQELKVRKQSLASHHSVLILQRSNDGDLVSLTSQAFQIDQRMTEKAEASPTTGVRLIAIFKLVKGFLLFAVGMGALKLLHKDMAGVLMRWINILRVDPNNRFIHRLLVQVWFVDDRTLARISAGTFFYAALLFTEGVGLWLAKRWAKYFTVIITASLLPLEAYELVKRFSMAKIFVIVINVAVVWYLVATLMDEPKDNALSFLDK